jgi:hypothetical protein
MAETQLATQNGAIPATDAPLSLEERKERLAATLLAKLEQGFQVVSQTDTEAILVTKGRRRWFGIARSGADSRQTTSIDEQGRARTRPL